MQTEQPTLPPVAQLRVGEEFQISWSNGAGFSRYRLIDDPGAGQHLLSLVGEFEYVNYGFKRIR